MLLTSPFLYALKEAYPEAQIDCYIPKGSYPMLEGHPALNKAFFKEDGFTVFFALRKEKYDLAFNLTEGDRGALACLFSRAKVRVGVDPGKSGFLFKRKIFSHLVEHCPNPKHTIEKNLDALRVLGFSPTPECRALTLAIPEEVEEKIHDEYGTGYILFHPVSRWLFKSLPSDTNAKIVNALVAEGHRVVLSSGPGVEEMRYIEALQSQLKYPVESAAGKTTLKELGALIRASRLVVCPDSVPFHMANALQKPVVTYFGPTSEKNWGPWRNPHATVITQELPCRPCFRAGCANTKISDCLVTLCPERVLNSIRASLAVETTV